MLLKETLLIFAGIQPFFNARQNAWMERYFTVTLRQINHQPLTFKRLFV